MQSFFHSLKLGFYGLLGLLAIGTGVTFIPVPFMVLFLIFLLGCGVDRIVGYFRDRMEDNLEET